MKISELLNEGFPGSNKNKIYQLLVDAYNCGPFDGGCVIFARALQLKFGGDIIALCNRNIAQHAVLYVSDMLIDADGEGKPEDVIDRFADTEQEIITNIRPLKDTDLSDAPRDEELSKQIADLL
jgi:hypothetical protein